MGASTERKVIYLGNYRATLSKALIFQVVVEHVTADNHSSAQEQCNSEVTREEVAFYDNTIPLLL